MFAAIRILVNPADPQDMKQAHALQDAVKVSQKSAGKLEAPNWDPVSRKKVRDALLVLNETLPDLSRAGGRRGEVDPVRHLIATATAWGLNPDKDAIYLNVTPADNDGKTVYRLNVEGRAGRRLLVGQRVQRAGLLREERRERVHAQQHHREERRRRLGRDPVRRLRRKTPNCLPIMKGWNYMVRLYRPRNGDS